MHIQPMMSSLIQRLYIWAIIVNEPMIVLVATLILHIIYIHVYDNDIANHAPTLK